MNSLSHILSTKPSRGYELLDSGNGEKLERFGDFVLRRPDPQALWQKSLPTDVWEKADAQFVTAGRTGTWKKNTELPDSWSVEISGLTFTTSLLAFKHTGIFPEQSENWNWIMETIRHAQEAQPDRKFSVLNLFGYTGGATLAAAKAGADVCHVDGSKVSVKRAGENAQASGLQEKPIRWIVDDALSFVKREVRRGSKYDAIIMDPPSYGHGPKREVWKIEESLSELISECKKLLSPNPLFVIVNGYAAGYSGIAYKNNIEDLVSGKGGEIEFGELALEAKNGKLLPAGIFARWRQSGK